MDKWKYLFIFYILEKIVHPQVQFSVKRGIGTWVKLSLYSLVGGALWNGYPLVKPYSERKMSNNIGQFVFKNDKKQNKLMCLIMLLS
jgi:hypothetical protein